MPSDTQIWSLEPAAIAFNPHNSQMGLARMTFNPESVVIAQQFDEDVLGDLGSAFSNFYESGQIWALLIGIVLGYVIRGMTTYS